MANGAGGAVELCDDAALLTTLTYAVAALLYVVLAVRPLDYPRTVLVQISSTFVNRLLPAG